MKYHLTNASFTLLGFAVMYGVAVIAHYISQWIDNSDWSWLVNFLES